MDASHRRQTGAFLTVAKEGKRAQERRCIADGFTTGTKVGLYPRTASSKVTVEHEETQRFSVVRLASDHIRFSLHQSPSFFCARHS